MLKEYKNTYLIISNVLVGWQKEQKNINLEQEQSKVEEQLRKMSEVVNNFGKFSEVKELINKICYFELDSKDKDKFTIIDNYYNEKKEEIEQNYKFENVPQFRSIINLRDLLIETINQKNDFAQILEDFHKEYLNFSYNLTINSIILIRLLLLN